MISDLLITLLYCVFLFALIKQEVTRLTRNRQPDDFVDPTSMKKAPLRD